MEIKELNENNRFFNGIDNDSSADHIYSYCCCCYFCTSCG